MNEERMSARQYAKFDKVFFLYGSLSKMVNPVRPDEWKQLAEEMWAWAIVKVAALVDDCTNGFIEPPPDLSEHEDVPTNGTNPNVRVITVKEKQVLKSGENGNRKWTLTKLITTDNVSYTTFAGSRYEVGKEYPIEFQEIRLGENIYLQIKEPK